MKKNILTFLSFFLITSLILMPSSLIKAASDGINIWLFSVFPSVFPFMVSSSMLISSGGAAFLGKIFSLPFSRLFNISSNGVFAFLSGIICGYPIGAKSSAELYGKGLLTYNEAFSLLSFSMNAGPAFMLSAVACSMLGCPKAGYILLFSTIFSNIASGILICRIFKPSKKYALYACKTQYMSAGEILTESIKNSLDAVLKLGGYIIFFSVFTQILVQAHIFSLLSKFMPLPNDIAESILTGIIEMTCGLKKVSLLNTAIGIKIILSAFLLSFGGFCVHFQSYEFFKDIPNSSLLKFSFFKLVNGILSAAVAAVIVMIFKV